MNKSMRVCLASLLVVAKGMLVSNSVMAAPISGQGTWETTLHARDLNNDGVIDAFYDTDLNITWLRDANAIGLINNWADGVNWAQSLTFGGYSDWRLPAMTTTATYESGAYHWSYGGTIAGYAPFPSSSEMAHLFLVTLGKQPGYGLVNTGDFQNMQSADYWTGTEFVPNAFAWRFNTPYGYQDTAWEFGLPNYYAMAVRDGDVASVPEPETYTLTLAALSLLGLARGRKQA